MRVMPWSGLFRTPLEGYMVDADLYELIDEIELRESTRYDEGLETDSFIKLEKLKDDETHEEFDL